MEGKTPSRENGILHLIDHMDEYLDKIISGELSWNDLLEGHMTPGALAVKKEKEKKVNK